MLSALENGKKALHIIVLLSTFRIIAMRTFRGASRRRSQDLTDFNTLST